jgi:hypothetical protein
MGAGGEVFIEKNKRWQVLDLDTKFLETESASSLSS